MSTERSSRRDFLRASLPGAALLWTGGVAGSLATVEPVAAESGAAAGRSRVVVARDEQLRGAGASPASSIDSNRVLALLDRAMQALFGQEHPLAPVDAWRRLVHPGERVGLKVNTLGGRGISTNVQLVAAICERLQQAGVKPADIVIWDRDTGELERAGFHLAMGGDRVQCFGTDRVGYEEKLAAWGSVGGCLSKILTQLPEIRSRMRLTICDATTAMYEGGPGYKPEHSWNANALLVSTDPVALDSTGWQMIERKRAEKGLKTLTAEKRAPSYIVTAADADHRLGTNDPRKISVVEV